MHCAAGYAFSLCAVLQQLCHCELRAVFCRGLKECIEHVGCNLCADKSFPVLYRSFKHQKPHNEYGSHKYYHYNYSQSEYFHLRSLHFISVSIVSMPNPCFLATGSYKDIGTLVTNLLLASSVFLE